MTPIDRPKGMRKGEVAADGRHAFLSLGRGMVVVVDHHQWGTLAAWKWYAKVDKRKRRVYARARICGRWVLLHRLVRRPEEDDLLVDHKNFDGLDCRDENLRVCTTGQNNANRPATLRSRSRTKGVWRVGRKWRAEIQYEGKKRCLGRYSRKRDAVHAYNQAASQIHGEFAAT